MFTPTREYAYVLVKTYQWERGLHSKMARRHGIVLTLPMMGNRSGIECGRIGSPGEVGMDYRS